jgi:hypothetical protein
MRLYLGHICVAICLIAVGLAIACAVLYGISLDAGQPQFDLVIWTFGLLIGGLILGAVGAHTWTNRWERRALRGSRQKRADRGYRPAIPLYPFEGLSEAYVGAERTEDQ